jgi:3-oxoacyl-(acyl-carrier-protein) synthase
MSDSGANSQGRTSWRSATVRDSAVLLKKASKEALLSAGFHALPEASGVCIGTTSGCSLHFLQNYVALRDNTADADERESIETFFRTSLALDFAKNSGPALTISNACTSGADAIGLAAQWIRTGLCEVALAGGADALSLYPYIGFNKLMIYSPEPCRPFAADRSGLNLGEGAGILILESSAHAIKRGVSPKAVLSGFGAASDAHHLTAPHPQGRGLRAAITSALKQSELQTKDIAFINAHGTATIENDQLESLVYNEMFQATPVWASKGSTGHCLGAAGAIEAVLTISALTDGIVPASSTRFAKPGNENSILPGLTLAPLRSATAHAMSVSLGFGGSNAALIFSIPEGGPV